MTGAALRQTQGPARDAAATHSAVARLRRRSLMIHFWRGALPAVIGVALVGMGAWATMRTLAGLAPAERGVGDIRMLNPEFHGRDKNGDAYVVTAQSAVRDAVHTERTSLERPHLVMNSAARGQLRVSALSGNYDETTRVMNLWGGVVADNDQGNHFESPTARVDTGNNRAEGHDGVVATGPLGRVTGSSYAIDDKSGHVLLSGGVHTHLLPPAGKP
jgi:lipopolysaccharide export system protein LptC